MSDLPPSIPRAYQSELFTQACDGNIIAVMGTGTGKTLIAINLIKWLAAHTMADGRKQLAVFLVPSVPLVFQQTEAIRAETPLIVKPYCGEMGVDFWDHERWIVELDLENTDVLVMTPQIFYNILAHAYLDIRDVGSIVMDEVHHCRKRHPYNTIMEEFYHRLPPTARPKILGLTASPIWNLKDPLDGLRVLEMNTQCKVVAVKTHAKDLDRHTNKPVEEVAFYRPTFGSVETTLYNTIMALGLSKVNKVHLKTVFTRALVTLDHLGGAAMDRYLLESLLQPTREVITLQQLTSPGELLDERLFRLKRVLEERTRMKAENGVSRKVKKVVQVLQDHREQKSEKSDYQAIIFVQQRHIASGLTFLLNEDPDLDWISARTLVGHGSHRVTAVDNHDFKRQQAIVADFRAGLFNVLVSTSVGEEGLDFPACDLVIRFDVLQTMIGYMQSRGRARMKKSKYIVMIDETNGDGYGKYLAYSGREGTMTDLYKSQRGPIPEYDEEENDIDERDRLLRERYAVESTGAILTYGEAVSLVYQTCSLLPSNEDTDRPAPLFDISGAFEAFSATITMPTVTSLPRDKLNVAGGWRSNRKEAKRAAAFQMCKILHEHGLLNDRLLPHREKAPEDMVTDEPDLEPELVVQVHPTWGQESMRDPAAKLYLHRIRVDKVSQIGIICNRSITPVDAFPLWKGYIDEETQVTIEMDEPLPVDFTRIQGGRHTGCEILDTATRYMISMLLRRTWAKPNDLATYFALLDSHGDIDWQSMLALSSTSASQSFTAGTLLHDSFGKQVIMECVRSDLNPMSPPVPVDGICRESESESYLDYANNHLRKTKASWEAEITTDTPMLQVRRLASRRNNLQPAAVLRKARPLESTKNDTTRREILISSLCTMISIAASVREDIMLLPAIMRRIVDLDRLRTPTSSLNLSRIPRDILHQALTPPAASFGYDYQRLETLGDNVLKILTTVCLFQQYPLKHEGALDSYRMVCVSNKYLRRRGFDMGLGGWLCGEEVLIRRWEPPIVGPHSVIVKRKWLQDCLEALLGAAYLSGGIPSAIQLGAQFCLRTGSLDMWNQHAPAQTGIQTGCPHALRGLQQVLGYQFKSVGLLVEALTHPSFPSPDTRPYDRLEFLGDTVIDFYILRYLYAHYPDASPGLLTFLKRCIVCNAGLAYVAVRQLRLHLHVFRLSQVVDQIIRDGVLLIESLDLKTMMEDVWEYHPPKVLGDVMESVLGAVFVDSGYDLEVCDRVMEPIFKESLEALKYAKRDDPAQELFMWTRKMWNCTHLSFERRTLVIANIAIHEMIVMVHGEMIASAKNANKYVAKCTAAQQALELLQREEGMKKICTCSDDEEMEDCDVELEMAEEEEEEV